MSFINTVWGWIRQLRRSAGHTAPRYASNVHALHLHSAVALPKSEALQVRRQFQGPVRKPGAVRVLRVSEPGMPATTAGRMVMSGRMADVCAELDRLAA